MPGSLIAIVEETEEEQECNIQNCLLGSLMCINLPYLIFREPRIVVHSYNKTNEMHQFLKFIFGIELYMFRTVSLSITRSLALYTRQ